MRKMYECDWQTRRELNAEAWEREHAIDPAVARIMEDDRARNPQPPPVNQLLRLAASFNESGHAIMSFRTGKPIYQLEVSDDGSGICRHIAPEVTTALRTAEMDTRAWKYLAEHAGLSADFVKREVLVLLGGPAATEKATGGHSGCATDFKQARLLVDGLPLSPRERQQRYDDLNAEARSFIFTFFDEVEAVAKRLYDVGVLHESEIKQILRRTFAGRVIILGDTSELRQQRAQRSATRNAAEEVIFQDGVPVGIVRHGIDNQYTAHARGGLGLRAQGASKEDAATALLRMLAKEKIRFRVDGKMGAFV